MTNIEILILILLVSTLILPFKLFNKNNRLTFGHPLIFYSLTMLYYTVFSPILRILLNETSNKIYDFRNQFILGWIGALLSVISVLIGYSLNTNLKKKITRSCNLNYQSIWSIGLIFNIIGFVAFMIVRGFDLNALNPFILQSNAFDFLIYDGALANYLVSGQELLVVGNLLMFASAYTTQKKFPLTVLIILTSCGLFLNSGFRFRFFFLFASILLFLLTKESKLKAKTTFKFGIFAIFLTLSFMTYLGQIRIYGEGIDINQLSISGDFLKNIFIQGESSIFITTSGLINIVPEKVPYQNFYPIFKSLIHFLPSAFFDKNSGDYLFYVTNAIYGFKDIFYGAAYLNYGEYYLMFGWFGVFIFNFILGYLFKRLWFWINLHKQEPMALLVYLLNLTFTFMIISRGYLSQQFHLYVLTVLPLNLIYYLNSKQKLNRQALQ